MPQAAPCGQHSARISVAAAAMLFGCIGGRVRVPPQGKLEPGMKTALITGITGQDGGYLARFLLGKGYRVHGLLRRSASANVGGERLRWLGIEADVEMADADLTDLSSILRVMEATRPDEVYNLGAQSFVKTSWTQPLLTGQVTGIGAVNMLEAVRIMAPGARLYHASSSEMFGLIQAPVQNETTPF